MSEPHGYQVLEPIACTAGSQVYRARPVGGGATVLIKKAESSAQLRNEFRLLRSLSLPGVVKALELLNEHNQPTLVLEDFAGDSFETALARQPRIDWPTGLAIA